MLELTTLELVDGHANLNYTLQHSGSGLRTFLELPIAVKVNAATGKVRATLTVGQVEADNLDEAVAKLTSWCERGAAALRYSRRKPFCDIPVFERQSFNYEGLPSWLRKLYDQLVIELMALSEGDIRTYIAKMAVEHHPLLLVPGALDMARNAVDRAGAGP